MTYQELLNVLIGGGLTVVGWFCHQMWTAVNELKKDLSVLREELPHEYISKYDYRCEIVEIKSILIRIDEKIDKKVDK